jgi:hypothetical protein
MYHMMQCIDIAIAHYQVQRKLCHTHDGFALRAGGNLPGHFEGRRNPLLWTRQQHALIWI